MGRRHCDPHADEESNLSRVDRQLYENKDSKPRQHYTQPYRGLGMRRGHRAPHGDEPTMGRIDRQAYENEGSSTRGEPRLPHKYECLRANRVDTELHEDLSLCLRRGYMEPHEDEDTATRRSPSLPRKYERLTANRVGRELHVDLGLSLSTMRGHVESYEDEGSGPTTRIEPRMPHKDIPKSYRKPSEDEDSMLYTRQVSPSRQSATSLRVPTEPSSMRRPRELPSERDPKPSNYSWASSAVRLSSPHHDEREDVPVPWKDMGRHAVDGRRGSLTGSHDGSLSEGGLGHDTRGDQHGMDEWRKLASGRYAPQYVGHDLGNLARNVARDRGSPSVGSRGSSSVGSRGNYPRYQRDDDISSERSSNAARGGRYRNPRPPHLPRRMHGSGSGMEGGVTVPDDDA